MSATLRLVLTALIGILFTGCLIPVPVPAGMMGMAIGTTVTMVTTIGTIATSPAITIAAGRRSR
jgi:hypothetical protein